MGLKIGIVGLPNVGKSTVFNALTRTQNAEVANYPFCTIEPNRAIVPVPDLRLDQLREATGRPNIIYATIEFVDIAGLVEGASRGEGLGNQFLGNIRDTDAILHVVRCFEDPNVVHVRPKPDPAADIETVNTELMLADLEQIERRIERLESQVKGDRKAQPLLDAARGVHAHLAAGRPAATFPDRESDAYRALNRELRLLSGKPVIYAANVGEAELHGESLLVTAVQQAASAEGADVVVLAAALEMELADLSEDERQEYLQLAGVEESGLDQLIRKSYERLGLISFFTMNESEVRAWTISRGTPAPQAAGVIHTDFERGFIRAEVLAHETFLKHGSLPAARSTGELRAEGREYLIQDGDVVHFRFNV